MTQKSKIEWTERTWNPVTGCTKISQGCKHCYAEKMATRLQAMGTRGYENGFNQVTLLPYRLEEPLSIRKPALIFVNSMSDLFHEEVPFDFIDKVFDTIKKAPQHVFQVLTKRAERMKEYFNKRVVPDNVWLGVTVEMRQYLERIFFLKQITAKVKFVSIEPLLEDLNELEIIARGIDLVIVGGESGRQARPMKKEWVLKIKEQCEAYGIDFYFKQWGTWGPDGVKRNKTVNGRVLDSINIPNL